MLVHQTFARRITRCAMILFVFGLTGCGASALAASTGTSTAKATANPAHTTRAVPAALRPVLYRALAKDTGAAYGIKPNGCAVLPKQALKACFDTQGAHFRDSGATPLTLHLVAFGRSGELTSVGAVRPTVNGNQASYGHDNLTEWWRVLPVGFEQGFTIAKRPSGNGELTLALAASRQDAGAPTIRHSRESGNPVERNIPTGGRDTNSDRIPVFAGMTKKEQSNTLAWGKLRYGELVVTDANGKVIPATLTSKGDRVLIAVNDVRAVYPLTVDPLVWLEQKVTASDGVSFSNFGWSVAVSGTTALVGSPNATVNGNLHQGAAYVFNESDGRWSEAQKLTASDGAAGDNFGISVTLDGTTALIGATGKNTTTGAAYVFGESGGTWTQMAELTASDGAAHDNFGISVGLDGATALVGAYSPLPEFPASGAAYVFTESGGLWAQTQKLVANDGAVGDTFGVSVALDGTTALIGAAGKNTATGAAYVFGESGGIWTQTAEVTASDGAAGDAFGISVALDGTSALVGAADKNGGTGAAYVFGDSGGVWTQTAELTASDGVANDTFGDSVALSGSIALIGAPSATVSGNVGQGAAYVFADSGGMWAQTGKLTADDGAAGDSFGSSVALSGTTALGGARGENNATGAAYFEGESDLGFAVSAPGTVALGENYLSQTIATNNASAASPAVSATMSVPAAASFISATASQGSCSEAAGVVTCDFGAIPGNAGTATVNVTLKAAKNTLGTTIGNTASVVHATPALTASAATAITCPAGYTEYDGSLAPGELWKSPRYHARAGIQNGILIAGDGIKLFAAYWHHDTRKWRLFVSSRENTIHHWGPKGQYHWLANARGLGPGGDYALCVLHP